MSYLEIIVSDSLFIEIPDLEPSATLEWLGLDDLLNLDRSVCKTLRGPALLSESTASESPLASDTALAAHGSKESLLFLRNTVVERGIVSELWKVSVNDWVMIRKCQ